MLKLLLLAALIAASVASHLGGNRWNVIYTYAGNSCQGEPLSISATLTSSCPASTTPTCIVDVGDLLGTSFTSVCVTTLRDSIKTLPSNYTAEIIYRMSEGNNCTNVQGASSLSIYSMNRCLPTLNGQTNDGWRFYDTCNNDTMSSQRGCSNTCGNTCTSRTTRPGNTCYSLNDPFIAMYACNTFNQAILDVVAAPASFLKPTLFLTAVLALICW